MNRSKVIFIAAATGVCMLLASCCAVPDLSFSQEVMVYWNSGAESETVVSITDSKDIEAIAEACTKEVKPGSGDCGFNVYKLVFKGEGRIIVLRPAGDSCDTIQVGESEHDNAENMYMMGRDNRKKLAEILGRYGVMMDFIESE